MHAQFAEYEELLRLIDAASGRLEARTASEVARRRRRP